jgi:hypothetical protein
MMARLASSASSCREKHSFYRLIKEHPASRRSASNLRVPLLVVLELRPGGLLMLILCQEADEFLTPDSYRVSLAKFTECPYTLVRANSFILEVVLFRIKKD